MILAGDIGGTNARFGCYAGGERIGVAELDADAFANGDELLAAALAELPGHTIDACCLAVAGPVLGDAVRLTNVDIGFSRSGISATTGADSVALVNDMVALGSAVGGLPDDRFELLSGEPVLDALSTPDVDGQVAYPTTVGERVSILDRTRRVRLGVKCVLAAGTGLGMVVVADGKCLPSEGGHARVAPVGAFERELVAFTESEVEEHGGIVAWEHYLSGRGVEALHRAVCAVWGTKPETAAAREITRRGLAMEDPVCHTTVETLAGMLATAAGGLAVTTLSVGGVYLGGSVPVAIEAMLRDGRFRRRFEDAAWAAGFLKEIPIHLIADPLIGLDGAHLIALGDGSLDKE